MDDPGVRVTDHHERDEVLDENEEKTIDVTQVGPEELRIIRITEGLRAQPVIFLNPDHAKDDGTGSAGRDTERPYDRHHNLGTTPGEARLQRVQDGKISVYGYDDKGDYADVQG